MEATSSSSATEMMAPQEEREGEYELWLGGRGPRLTQAQKRRIREYCLRRDGARCMVCGKEEDPINLQIDHRDGNASNHIALNLQLAHQRCNVRAYFANTQTPTMLSIHPQRENRTMASQLGPSHEVLMNREYEPLFRRYCFIRVREAHEQGLVLCKAELRIEAREYVGCSQQTSYSYVERLFAKNGPLMECEDVSSGELYVRFRDPTDLNLTIEQLDNKYPKEGRRKSTHADLR